MRHKLQRCQQCLPCWSVPPPTDTAFQRQALRSLAWSFPRFYLDGAPAAKAMPLCTNRRRTRRRFGPSCGAPRQATRNDSACAALLNSTTITPNCPASPSPGAANARGLLWAVGTRGGSTGDTGEDHSTKYCRDVSGASPRDCDTYPGVLSMDMMGWVQWPVVTNRRLHGLPRSRAAAPHRTTPSQASLFVTLWTAAAVLCDARGSGHFRRYRLSAGTRTICAARSLALLRSSATRRPRRLGAPKRRRWRRRRARRCGGKSARRCSTATPTIRGCRRCSTTTCGRCGSASSRASRRIASWR